MQETRDTHDFDMYVEVVFSNYKKGLFTLAARVLSYKLASTPDTFKPIKDRQESKILISFIDQHYNM